MDSYREPEHTGLSSVLFLANDIGGTPSGEKRCTFSAYRLNLQPKDIPARKNNMWKSDKSFPDTLPMNYGEAAVVDGKAATWPTRILYCLALLAIVMGQLGQSSWIGMVTGGGLSGMVGRPGFLLISAFLIFRIYLVLRYRASLQARQPNLIGWIFRVLGMLGMATGTLGAISVFFVKPLTLLLLKDAGVNGIGYFVVGLFAAFLSNAGWMGCVLFEISRAMGMPMVQPVIKPVGLRKQDLAGGAALVLLVLGGPYLLRPTAGASTAMQSAPDPAFTAACEHTGVQILKAPTEQVRSIYLNWRTSDFGVMNRYKIGPGEVLEKLDDSLPYPEMIVNSPLADVVVTYHASDPREVEKVRRYQGLIQYNLTATDRRDGTTLATMTFATDFSKRRACGANVKDGIDVDAFLRQATSIPGQAPDKNSTLPIQEMTAEVVATEIYSPERAFTLDQWSDFMVDGVRNERCKTMMPVVGPRRRRFAADPSGLNSFTEQQPQQLLCEPNVIVSQNWTPVKGGYREVIAKYTPSGDLLYKIGFSSPENFKGYYGGIVNSTLRIKDGYVVFDWINSDQSGMSRFANRRLTMRVSEPGSILAPPVAPLGKGPIWASYFQDVVLEELAEPGVSSDSPMKANNFDEIAADTLRKSTCDAAAPKTSPGSEVRRFAADETGKNRMLESKNILLCDGKAIWTGRYLTGQSQSGYVVELEKYSLTGVLAYKVRFNSPLPLYGESVGGIMLRTLTPRDGFTSFEMCSGPRNPFAREEFKCKNVRFREPLADYAIANENTVQSTIKRQ